MKERVSYDRVRAVFWVARIVAPRPRKKKEEEEEEEKRERRKITKVQVESETRAFDVVGRAGEEKVNSLCPPREKEEDDL